MDTTEKISVIIPTYNRANLIERSVRSVLDQTYDNLEVIVVNDCSTDDTQEMIGRINDQRLLVKKLFFTNWNSKFYEFILHPSYRIYIGG